MFETPFPRVDSPSTSWIWGVGGEIGVILDQFRGSVAYWGHLAPADVRYLRPAHDSWIMSQEQNDWHVVGFFVGNNFRDLRKLPRF